MASIFFHSADRILYFTGKKALKHSVEGLFRLEKTSLLALHYIFCSDEYLLQINQEFLKHDTYTDIITFNLAFKGAKVEGEVYISLDRVRENARLLDVPYQKEVARVVFHGALHLCGYRDKSLANRLLMRKKENIYLKRLESALKS
jgi:probable rRNA maturation factor